MIFNFGGFGFQLMLWWVSIVAPMMVGCMSCGDFVAFVEIGDIGLWWFFFKKKKKKIRIAVVIGGLMWNFFGTASLRPWVVATSCASDGLCVVVVGGCSYFR